MDTTGRTGLSGWKRGVNALGALGGRHGWRWIGTAVVMTAALAGCGGGGGGTSADSPATTPVANPGLSPVSYSLSLGVKSGQVGIGRSITLTAVVVDNSGKDVTGAASFVWTSATPAVATVTSNAAVNGTATVAGVAAGVASVSVVATVKAADNSTVVLPTQVATITVDPALITYALALPAPALSMTDGQSLPIKVSVVASDGVDDTAAVHDWAWASSSAAVQVTPNGSNATLFAVNKSDTEVATAIETVSATAPNGLPLSGQILVTVMKNTGYTYRLDIMQGGTAITALSVLNGYPQRVNTRVIRNDGNDSTADFDGTWTYGTASPTLSVAADPATRDAVIGTSRANGLPPLQSVLNMTAASSKIAATPRGSLTVTEQPTWALVYNGPAPLRLSSTLPLTIPVTATLKYQGNDDQYFKCVSWNWTTTGGNVTLSPGVHEGQKGVSPVVAGPFTLKVGCLAGTDLRPLSLTISGVVE